MKKVKFDINTDGERNWLSITAVISNEEIERLTPFNRNFLNQDIAGNWWITNCPCGVLGSGWSGTTPSQRP
jgi:hypothetical protein